MFILYLPRESLKTVRNTGSYSTWLVTQKGLPGLHVLGDENGFTRGWEDPDAP